MTERKDEILAAAIAIADERGLEAVSMRSVADRVGVTPMALYPYVGSKTALLDAMYGRIVSEYVPAVPATADWRERMRSLATAARSLAKQRPWVVSLMLSRPSVVLDAVRVTDALYQALLDAGVPDADVPRMERLLSTFFLGYSASESGGRFGAASENLRGSRGQLPEGRLPGHARLAPWLDQVPDWDAEFEADLQDLEQLILAKARPRPS
ncbi:MAG TPA: TetR/AcrR family transcriptional regulator [Streptosporangiaceae bacterium]|nr:TetR/AcrR family transcriptional regulator [Streptosporangiaceae bacterium]